MQQVHEGMCLTYLNVGLAFDSVEVFMQAVQQEGQKLLAVLLAVALELRGKLAQLPLEIGWGDRCCVALHSSQSCR